MKTPIFPQIDLQIQHNTNKIPRKYCRCMGKVYSKIHTELTVPRTYEMIFMLSGLKIFKTKVQALRRGGVSARMSK